MPVPAIGMRPLAILVAFAATLASTPARATCVPITSGLPGWERLDFEKVPPNTWTEEGGALVASSNATSSILYAGVPSETAPVLTWRWRVDRAAPPTDLTRKGGDDRSLSLTVGFAYDPIQATMGEKMKRMVVESMAGADAPGRVIEFAWGGTGAAGVPAASPYSGSSGRIVTLRPATDPTGQWQTERVDLAALYRQIWGGTPPPVTRVALLTDSDDTGGATEARIADICFEGG